MRYTKLLQDREASVTMHLPAPLAGLASELEGVDVVTSLDDRGKEMDYGVYPLSLPHIFGTTLRSIPGSCPYLSIPADRSPPTRVVSVIPRHPRAESRPRLGRKSATRE